MIVEGDHKDSQEAQQKSMDIQTLLGFHFQREADKDVPAC